MMERVIQNLLVNAINYPKENVIIVLEVRFHQNDEIVFSIANNASNFSAEIISWFNINNNETRPLNSVIGLSIVKKVLQLHNFELRVETRNINNF